MTADADTENVVAPIAQDHSMVRGDVPGALKRRYYTDERGGGLNFYVGATSAAPASRDRGRELVAPQADPNVIRDMAIIAEHRGWKSVAVHGSPEFRREMWLTGRSMGLEVWGYRANGRDLQELERRQSREDRGVPVRERRQEKRNDDRSPAETRRDAALGSRQNQRGAAQMRIVEAVVRARVQDPEGQRRIIDGARTRIADWLERGARFDPQLTQRIAVPERRRGR